MHFEWWHWMVLGVVLVLLELAIPAFFVVWFGLGALVVGLALAVAPGIPLPGQIALWILASIAFVLLWFKVFKSQVHRTRVGLSEGQFIGEIGLATQPIMPYQRGKVRFQKPILGSDVWEAIANEDIAVGERIKVIEVEGSLLKVAKN
jgi:membrane protein implicated in regulation of membrane protease activity